MDVMWLGMAYLLGLGANFIGLPPLVGYLVVGFTLSGFGQAGGALLHDLAHSGVLLLLFTVGLKLRFQNLLRREVLVVGLVHFVAVTAVATVALAATGLFWRPAGFLAAGLAFSSTVLAAKVLESKRELRAFHGRVAMGILILQDLIAVAIMSLIGAGDLSPWIPVLLVLPLLRPLLFRLFALSGHTELLLLMGIVLALAGAALFEELGLSGELGAIVIGLLLAGHPRAAELSNLLWSVKEFFLVAFFVEIGFAGLPSLGQLAGGLALLLLLPVKSAVFFFLLARSGVRARNAFLAALALSSYSEFALITTRVGVDAGLVPAAWLSAIVVPVALSFALAAPLNRVAHGLYERFEVALARFQTPNKHPDRQPLSLGRARFLVIGVGRIGSSAYDLLREAGESVVGLDSDPAQLERNLAHGRRVLYGDAEDPELWAELHLDGVAMILFTITDLEAKLRAVGQLRKIRYGGVVGATFYFPEEAAALKAAGVSMLFNPYTEAGARLARLSLEGLRPQPPTTAT